jgi:hypothetical protein
MKSVAMAGTVRDMPAPGSILDDGGDGSRDVARFTQILRRPVLTGSSQYTRWQEVGRDQPRRAARAYTTPRPDGMRPVIVCHRCR